MPRTPSASAWSGHDQRMAGTRGDGIRVDAGYHVGNTVTPFYDPLLAKLIVWGPDRPAALDRARGAVADFHVSGPKCNLPFFTELRQPVLRQRAI